MQTSSTEVISLPCRTFSRWIHGPLSPRWRGVYCMENVCFESEASIAAVRSPYPLRRVLWNSLPMAEYVEREGERIPRAATHNCVSTRSVCGQLDNVMNVDMFPNADITYDPAATVDLNRDTVPLLSSRLVVPQRWCTTRYDRVSSCLTENGKDASFALFFEDSSIVANKTSILR